MWVGIRAIWLRHMTVWKTYLGGSICSNFISPSLFLFAFGFGLGAMVKQAGGMPYLVFVVPGIIANAVFFNASFEGSIQAFSRFHTQKTYNAILASPVRLFEILCGELLVAATKSVMSALAVLLVAMCVGGVGSMAGGFIMLPVVFLCALSFAAFGLLFTAYAAGYETFNYFFALWVTPSFLFCGVFFEVTRFPVWLQHLVWLMPLTHMLEVTRALMSGHGVDPVASLLHIAYVLAFGAVCLMLAQRKMAQRLFA
jgi:lipooligosaccharide transport system permease protein